MDKAVIFDVDGVLLELTAAEEDIFFNTFKDWCDPDELSRDWNSYAIRNDDAIVDEIMSRHAIPLQEKPALVRRYFEALKVALAGGTLASPAIPGAAELLASLSGKATLGVATANFREAARLRLGAAGLWEPVAGYAFGADGGGHKHEVLARALAGLALPPRNIVYIGDNLSDVTAGLKNGVHFIGFSTDPLRRDELRLGGSGITSSDHHETRALIKAALEI